MVHLLCKFADCLKIAGIIDNLHKSAISLKKYKQQKGDFT